MKEVSKRLKFRIFEKPTCRAPYVMWEQSRPLVQDIKKILKCSLEEGHKGDHYCLKENRSLTGTEKDRWIVFNEEEANEARCLLAFRKMESEG